MTGDQNGWSDMREEEREALDEAWRGDVHADDWPESLAGPEYWLYRRQRDEEGA